MTRLESRALDSTTKVPVFLQRHLKALANLRQLVDGVTGTSQHPYPIDGQKLGSAAAMNSDASVNNSSDQAPSQSSDSGLDILLLLQVSGPWICQVSPTGHNGS